MAGSAPTPSAFGLVQASLADFLHVVNELALEVSEDDATTVFYSLDPNGAGNIE